jgi:enolase
VFPVDAHTLARYPIEMIEDALVEHDRDGFIALARAAGDREQVVGDDYLVTNGTRGAAATTWNEGLRVADELGGGGRLLDPKLSPWGEPR